MFSKILNIGFQKLSENIELCLDSFFTFLTLDGF